MGRYQEIELSGKTYECTAGPGVQSLALGEGASTLSCGAVGKNAPLLAIRLSGIEVRLGIGYRFP